MTASTTATPKRLLTLPELAIHLNLNLDHLRRARLDLAKDGLLVRVGVGWVAELKDAEAIRGRMAALRPSVAV